jgi:hypothetical protein
MEDCKHLQGLMSDDHYALKNDICHGVEIYKVQYSKPKA